MLTLVILRGNLTSEEEQRPQLGELMESNVDKDSFEDFKTKVARALTRLDSQLGLIDMSPVFDDEADLLAWDATVQRGNNKPLIFTLSVYKAKTFALEVAQTAARLVAACIECSRDMDPPLSVSAGLDFDDALDAVRLAMTGLTKVQSRAIVMAIMEMSERAPDNSFLGARLEIAKISEAVERDGHVAAMGCDHICPLGVAVEEKHNGPSRKLLINIICTKCHVPLGCTGIEEGKAAFTFANTSAQQLN